MASVNKVILMGNLGRDPEVRYAPSGAAVCNVSIATTRQWKDKSGERKEETEWHRVVFYDRLAEIAGEYLKKGRPVYVEGRLKYGKYTDKEGVERYTTDIIATEMQLLGSRDGAGDDEGGGYSRSRESSRPEGREGRESRESAPRGGSRAPAPSKPAAGDFDDMDDDIPF